MQENIRFARESKVLQTTSRSLQTALASVGALFPFPNYFVNTQHVCFDVAKTVMRYLDTGARILDFGSGPCDKTAVLQALGFQCTACDDLQDHWHMVDDNRQKILNFARASGFDFQLLSGGELHLEKNAFDMVMLHHVLEHLHDSPRDLLIELLESTKPQGLLYVTVPNAVNIRKRIAVLFGKTNLPPYATYYWYPAPWRGHIREYTRDDLLKMVKYLDLEIVEMRSTHHMMEKLSPLAQPIYRAITLVFGGWRDTWSMVARKRVNWNPRRTLSDSELDRLLGRSNVGT